MEPVFIKLLCITAIYYTRKAIMAKVCLLLCWMADLEVLSHILFFKNL